MPLPWRDVAALPPVVARFCRYAEVWTTSNPASDTVPSTDCQLALSRMLVEELTALNVAAELDAHGYVYADLPAPTPVEGLPVVGLCAHVDTSPDAPGENVRPMIHPDYDGGPVAFPGAPALVLDPARQPALAAHTGHDLITSDGTTLLGSDDKAGVAILMQLAEDLVRDEADAVERGERPAPRPHLRLLFTPDEEIARGTDHVDLDRWGADLAYTLDGSGTDTLNVETFHAAEAVFEIEGVGVHPGYAQGVLVNAAKLAAEIVTALAADPAPETTSGREGYLHPHTVEATTEEATIRVLLRDFDADGLDAKRARVEALAAEVGDRHPTAHVSVTVTDSYRNMREAIEAADPRTISVALAAGEAMGATLALEPIRGGTDGARLTQLGVPTPNVFTGGHDFHSCAEWNSVQNLERALAYTHALVRRWGAEAG
ncbi:peptidase T [Rubrivirga sp. IMCC43871]|uniref:peptidase T n=1 Tax=Rubrivirga sp. IMCC43871 TaxID=3391575 RepID=UPI0039902AB4